MPKERNEIKECDKWNLNPLFSDLKTWENNFEGVKKKFWDQIEAYKGKLIEGAESVKKLFDLTHALEEELAKLYTYAHLCHDEDIAHEPHKSAFDKATALFHQYSQKTSWIQPELLSLPAEKLQALAADAILKPYKMVLEKTLNLKEHTLGAKEEEILALAGKSLDASASAFRALNDADLKFPHVKNKDGEDVPLTHGLYMGYVREKDRTLRENAFKGLHRAYLGCENTFAELLGGVVSKHHFISKARNYKSCLESALKPHQIDPVVYDSLIEGTHGQNKELA